MSQKQDFVHLHAHSHFSVHDALPSPTEYANYAKDSGFPAAALTDHGKMGGCIEFVSACRNTQGEKRYIKPIVGVEAYVCEDIHVKQHVVREDGSKSRPKHNHAVLLAQNEVGYKNILKLCSIASEDGYYYDPRVDWNIIKDHSEGVIVLSGCLASETSQALLRGDSAKAEKIMRRYKEVFGDRYYVEFQYHGIESQKKIIPELKRLSQKLDIKPVASNDVHYLRKEDWKTHDVLIQMRDLVAARTTSKINKKKLAYETKQFYLKNYDEMFQIFENFYPEAITNTLEVSDRIEDFLKLDVPYLLPAANIIEDEEFLGWWKKCLPQNPKNEAYLAYVAFKGLRAKGLYNKNYIQRLKYELKQIWFNGVTDYFLIQYEMSCYMKDNFILYGIRGSGVSSLTNYCLGISVVDPIKQKLMFERFLNPGRGMKYNISFSSYSYEKWLLTNSSLDQTFHIEKIKNIVANNKEKHQDIYYQLQKEIWILENQDACAYYCYLLDNNFKFPTNEPNLWIAYVMGLTDEEPNGKLVISQVATLPDVDTDIDDSKRGQVIEWAKNRFGKDKVALISTQGTYKVKASVVNTLKVSPKFVADWGDRVPQKSIEISKTIPFKAQSIDEAKEMSPEFNYWANKYSDEIEIAKNIFGKISHIGVHAAGILISSEPIAESAPLERIKEDLVSAYDMSVVEHVGLVKYDYLGLSTYNMISRCLDMIQKRHNIKIDLSSLDFNDKKVFKLYSSGQTNTVFQCASNGMIGALKEVNVDRLEDIIAVLALYRPGPMDFIQDYARGKKNPKSVKYADPLIEKHLGFTYGIMVYQEQAMFLAREMAALSWEEVDKLRKGIAKKKGDDFEKACSLFERKALNKGVKKEIVDEVLNLMKKFGGYAFNMSHSCSYAIMSYWTAFLRVYYPAEWLAACMHVDRDDEDKMAVYKQECRKLKINVINPNINYSGFETIVTKDNSIALPLTSIKGVGTLVKVIVLNQPYESLEDLIIKTKPNKALITALINGGALDCFEEIANFTDRNDAIEYYNDLFNKIKKESNEKFKVLSPMLKIHNNNKQVVPLFGKNNDGLEDIS